MSVEAQFAINTYRLHYLSGAHGHLVGDSIQSVDYGAHGTAVTAVPDAGYHFVQWSDGLTEATRADSSVAADVSVEAQFAINTYRLRYLSGAHGHLVGDSIQTVNCGASGTAVTAVPDAGYRFVQWSDGLADNPRLDADVRDTITVEAHYELIRYILTISVIDADAKPIAFAKVKIGGMELKANDKGMAVDTLVPDRYSYTVECDGYDTKSGEVVLTTDTLVKVQLDKTSATGLFNTSIESLSVYPNPTTNGIYVEGSGDMVRIFSMGGRLVLQQPAFGRTYVDMERLPAGTYIVSLGKARAKVVKK